MNSLRTSQTQIVAAVLLVLGILAAGRAVTRAPPGADITLPDSPLYMVAVTESVKSLEGQKPDATPAQPCPDCGKIHARPESSGASLASSAALATTNYSYCAHCRIYHPAPHSSALQNLGAPHPH